MKEKKALEEAQRCLECKNAPCSKVCPSRRDIPRFIGKISEGDVDKSLEILMENNPFPESCGYVCPAPCQDSCILTKMGKEPIKIRDLEKYAAEEGEVKIEPVDTNKEKKVAVIGSGPAGLSVGYFLAREGYEVTVYERLPEAGGMLRYGIPDFRLPNDVLDREIKRIEKTGLEIKLDSPVEDIDTLFNQGYNAVFIGIGAHEPRWMNIPGEELEGVIDAISFLKKANLGQEVNLGKKTGVIGCGDVALDAVRFANRLDSEAFIIYRRSCEQMPANEEEYEECKEEGIEFNFLMNPTRILGDNGKVTALECIRTELGKPDRSGRKRPIPVKGSEFTVEVDSVIEAISQQPEAAWLKENDIEINKWNCIGLNEGDGNYATSREGVFAAGDAVTGTKTVSLAVGTAKKAAKSIKRYLDSLS